MKKTSRKYFLKQNLCQAATGMGCFAKRKVSQEPRDEVGRPGTVDLQQSPGKDQAEGLELECSYAVPRLVFD